MQPTALLVLLLVTESAAESTDTVWRRYLEEPPPQAIKLAGELATRADEVVAGITRLNVSGDMDVVCSGGGDLNGYYMGVLMVLSRVQAEKLGAPLLRQVRHAGASAGGWMSFEVALKGEARTLQSYLSYGLLEERYPVHFFSVASSVLLQDHHWRIMAAWQVRKWNASLANLDGKVTLAITCYRVVHRTNTSEKVLVDEYKSPEQAASAFIATGAIAEWYEVDGVRRLCADGSAASGERMTPLFTDHQRPQLIVDLMHVTNPSKTIDMGFGKFTSAQYAELVRRGQDEAAAFLQSGELPKRDGRALSLCPQNAKTESGICVTA